MKRILTRALIAVLVIGGFGVSGLVCARVQARGRYVTAFSTLGSGPEGTRGLFLLAERSGLAPQRWAEDLGRLPEGGVLVALGACDQLMRRPLGRLEKEALVAWIERGGTLIVAGVPGYLDREDFGVALENGGLDCRPSAGLLGMLARAEDATDDEERGSSDEDHRDEDQGDEDHGDDGPAADGDGKDELAELPGELVTNPVETWDEMTELDPEASLETVLPDGEALAELPPFSVRLGLSPQVEADREHRVLARYAGGQEPAIVEVPRGEGRIIALGSASLFQNRDLAAQRGGPLFVRLVGGSGGPLLFDEYHLGVGQRRGLMRYLRQIGVAAVALQVLAVLLLFLWRGGARFGVPLTAPPAPPGGTARYVEGVGILYEKSRDPLGAAAILWRRAKARLRAHHHLGPSGDGAALLERLGPELGARYRELEGQLAERVEGHQLTTFGEQVDALLTDVLARPATRPMERDA